MLTDEITRQPTPTTTRAGARAFMNTTQHPLHHRSRSTTVAPSRQPRDGGRIARPTRASLLLLGLAATALAACADETRRITGVSDQRPRLSVAVGEGMSLQCAPRPNITARIVTPGTDADLNGNGVVCDERLGPSYLPAEIAAPEPITSDDAPFPTQSDGQAP
jgi:hypothetical protein